MKYVLFLQELSFGCWEEARGRPAWRNVRPKLATAAWQITSGRTREGPQKHARLSYWSRSRGAVGDLATAAAGYRQTLNSATSVVKGKFRDTRRRQSNWWLSTGRKCEELHPVHYMKKRSITRNLLQLRVYSGGSFAFNKNLFWFKFCW